MLRKNLPGAILVCLILFVFISIGLYLGISLEWPRYLMGLGIVAVIAFIISAIISSVPAGKDKG